MTCKRLRILLILLMSIAAAIASAGRSLALDVKPGELAKLEKACAGEPRTKAQFQLINEALKENPEADQAKILSGLLSDTKWGTRERAAMSYVCAWYGVNYRSCRDYLLNITFWYDYGHHREGKADPESWYDYGVDLLFALYEHNLDFQLLHNIITTPSDGGFTVTILGCIETSAVKHPRGLLHVAEISNKGRRLILSLLSGGESGIASEFTERPALEAYFKRVAVDSKDSLSALAKGLLGEAAKLKNKR